MDRLFFIFSLNAHLKKHVDFLQTHPEYQTRTVRIQQKKTPPINNPTEKPYKCHECEEGFHSKRLLVSHKCKNADHLEDKGLFMIKLFTLDTCLFTRSKST